ncbi:hypothetical protein BGZ97_009724 [Linnemannia gamsii]|uniref:Uncharacterized protein n=1 Tax=Linnemannia gamsii TaxID=64522 RepID=A0A9P6UDV9_9FUNG|nr:hypothetical protein BGZ97_009724 [Linnemannia gamsii]
MARHSPKEMQQSPAKKARTGAHELSLPAQFTPTKKRTPARTIPSFDNVGPAHLISVLLEACTTYICNRAHAVLNKIETKDTLRGPSKNQVLQTQRQSLYRNLLKPSRLPDSVMPDTCQLIMDSCGMTGFI